MILKLKTLLITSTDMGSVWAALVGSADDSSGGLFTTGGYVISAFDTTGRVWISNQNPEAYGEGMETTDTKLADFLVDRLFTDDAANQIEVTREGLNALVADFYRQEF